MGSAADWFRPGTLCDTAEAAAQLGWPGASSQSLPLTRAVSHDSSTHVWSPSHSFSMSMMSGYCDEGEKLFEEHSDLLELFERFRSLKTREEQASSMELAEHATTVMNSLDEAIRALDDADTFFTFVEQVGASHRRIPGFQPELFWKIEKPFLEAVKTTLGDRYTDNVDTLYRATIKLIIETLINGYNNAQDNPQTQQKEQSS
ncbi:myoglobin-like [Schistocerca serialis cubense]|uniref:myoglobin-like n=1 Tax=Schistocerca serialis cubense TaxID=2023355 RepID=UPI00214E0BF1|nr:myoglobin-like [Schistocerca serialis cubense]